MSSNYVQILDLAATLSKEECLMLIKDISTALVANDQDEMLSHSVKEAMLKSAKETRRKVQVGEMDTFSLEEASA